MNDTTITVQRRGRIAVPEDVAGHFGMRPGAVFSVDLNHALKTMTLSVFQQAPESATTELIACPLEP